MHYRQRQIPTKKGVSRQITIKLVCNKQLRRKMIANRKWMLLSTKNHRFGISDSPGYHENKKRGKRV
jgi:hypothetical protein